MKTPHLDRLLQADDFGERTLVDAEPELAHGTPKPFPLVKLAASNAKSVRVQKRAKPALRSSQDAAKSDSELPVTATADALATATATRSRPSEKRILQVVEHQLADATPILRVDEVETLGPTTEWIKIGPEALEDSVPRNTNKFEREELDLTNKLGAPVTLDEPVEPEPKVIVETTPEQEWAEFKKIGLAPKKQRSTGFAKLIVSVYRFLGFGILAAIVFALIGYIAVTVFYMFSHTWLVPAIVSPNDDKVVALQRELTGLQNERDRIAVQLNETELAMAAEQQFQTQFAAAIESDLKGRRAALGRVRELAGAAAEVREKISNAGEELARESSVRIDQQYGAGMIDRHAMLDGKHQLAQITSSNLSLAEHQAAFETQALELSRQARSLDALLENKNAPLSYDVLKIKRDYDASKLAVTKAIDARKSLLASLARQDKMIADLKQQPLLRAINKHATVAQVPYANLGEVKPGTTLYACSLAMVWCHAVGKVVDVLPGEIQFRHPHKDTIVRGQLVEMSLQDEAAARDDVLFAGGKPLGL